MKKILYIINIILFGVLIFIIQYPEIQKAKIVNAKIAVYPSVAGFPVFIAENKGFFENEKMQVEVFYTTSPDVIDNLKKGKVDIVVGFPVIDFFIREKGEAVNFRIIADIEADSDYPYAAIFSFGRRLRNLKRIKKSFLFIPSQKLEGKVLAKKFEEKYKFDLKNLYEYSTLLPQTKEGAALVYEPFRTFLLFEKQKALVDAIFQKYITSPYIIGFVFCSKVTIVYNRKAVERFKKVWDEAVEFIRNNPEEAKKLFISYCIQRLNANFLGQERYKDIEIALPHYKKTDEISDLPYLSIVRALKNTEFLYTEPDLSPLFKLQ